MSSAGNATDGAGKGTKETDGAARHDALAGRWHKYVKPRVGQTFQVDKKVLRSLSAQSSDETDSERSSSAVACVAPNERAQSAVGGRRGRPARGREAAVRLNETLGVKAAHRVAAAASQHIVPERGGLCVHRPSSDGICGETDNFLEFSRNIIMQTPAWNSPEALSSLQRRWKDEIADKFGGPAYRRSGSNISTGSGRKRGRKRKVVESDDDASGIAASSSEKEDGELSKLFATEAVSHGVPSAVCVAQTPKQKVRSLEEDEMMLSYLQSIHKGNCDVAKFSMISDLSMGRAVQARRHLKKRRKEEEMEAPLSDMLYPSESWRRRYERLCSAMRGDVKNRSGLAKYSYITGEEPSQCCKGSGLDAIQFLSPQGGVDNQMLSCGEGLKQTWRSVLECAEDIVDRTSGGSKSKAKPSLKDLLALMGKAHTLMRPEEIFGKRDTSVKRISQCMNVIVDRVVEARNHLAKLFDIVYDEKDEGVELDVLEKYIEHIEAKSPVVIEETETLRKMVSEASQWERRLDHVLRPDHSDSSSLSESFDRNNVLAVVEQLASDAQVLSLRPRSLVLLEARIEKAQVLRSRIREMRQSESREGSENKKLIAALVREANKLDLVFPELTMLTEVHEAAQEWTDRASIAVRSRISLSELEDLVDRGDTMPVNLSDLLVKLRSRVSQANGWIARLRENLRGAGDDELETKLDETKWLEMIRKVLLGDDDRAAEIQDLAVEGSRIPVDIPELHLLQVEVDARNWSKKARKLLEKKAKIVDIREHLTRGETIRDKVPFDQDLKSAWTLGCEKELLGIVKSSDAWYRKYRPYLEGDNRRADGRTRISIILLRQIVSEGNNITANLGNASVKMNRILSQAEDWFNEHKGLLASFKILADKDSESESPASIKYASVKMDSVNVAIEKASELSVDLEEAMQLKALAEKSQEWFTRALAIAPKRSKRNARGKKKVNRERHSLDELLSLVKEAAQLPIDISEDLDRLQMQLTEVQSWRLQAQCEIKSISAAFDKLHSERLAYYGAPSSHMDKPLENQKGVTPIESNSQSPPKSTSKASEGLKVHRMIGNLVKSVQSISIYTTEEGVAEMLGRVSKWCTKAAVIIATPGHIFEKRYYKDLDNLIADGEVLLQESNADDSGAVELDDASLMTELKTSWVQLVSDDKIRLEKCQKRRDEFMSWCETTEAILSATDKKIPIETLRDLGQQSLVYPKGAETVKRVQTLLHDANAWIKSTGDIVNSGQKISLEDAKCRVSKGEGLSISCPEFRNLRNALRVSRGWQLRVKRSKLDSGQSQISDIKDLIEEHNGFLVCMPDEIKKLKEALQGYCLCRKPYEGFMVGCDTCEEWFHGPCIGVSESQAERYDKYVCVRCVISKLFKGCAETTVQAIRKWTNSKDLSKARQIDGQRHQRKVREKRREIEKLKTEIEALKSDSNLNNGNIVVSRNTDLGRDLSPQAATHFAEDANSIAMMLHNGSGQTAFGEAVRSTDSATGGSNGTEYQNAQDGVVSDFPLSRVGGPIDGSEEREAPLESAIKSNDAAGAREKLSKATATLENCHRRMDQLSEILNERRSREAREDTMSESLRQWFVLVRATVLVPDSTEQSKSSQPQRDGSLSSPMDQAVFEATKLGIRHLPDVSLVINSFGCMAWSLRALHVLSRKPKIEEIRSLVSQSEGVSFKLPETKCVRMLQSPLSRATLWQAKVVKALIPIPGEKKPYDLELLSSLLQGARDIPYTMPEESQLWNTIEDDGNRHCLCGGPSDGSFMISCDKCEVWYHGACVELDKTQGDAQSKWICPLCTGAVSKKTRQLKAWNKKQSETGAGVSDAKDPDHSCEEDISQYAPNVNDLWPPFGLLQNSTALSALGVSDPSDCEGVSVLTLVGPNASNSQEHHQQQLNKTKTPTSAKSNGCTSQSTLSKQQQTKQSETAMVVLGSGLAQSLPPKQQPSKGRGINSQGGKVLADTKSELSRAVQRAMQARGRMSHTVETSRSGTSHAQLIVQQREMIPQTMPPPGSGPPHQSLTQGRQMIPQASQAPRRVNSQSLTQMRQNPAQGIQITRNSTSQQLTQGRPILTKSTDAPRNLPSQRSTALGRQMLPQASKPRGSGPSQQSFGRQMLPQAARAPGTRPSQQPFAQGRQMLPQASQNPGSRPSQQSLVQGRQMLPQSAQSPGSRPSQQSLAQGRQMLPQAAQNPRSRPSQQPLAQGRHMLPQSAQNPRNRPSEQSLAQGRQMLPQAAQNPGSGPSQQSLAQGRHMLPQVAQQTRLSQQSLQLLLGGGLPRATGGRNETGQVTQAMQLMAQSLKNPASDAVQASQAMQMLAHGQESLSKGAEGASSCSSRATHTMQTPFHGREGMPQQANNARVAGGRYQTQPAQLIQGVERRPCQVSVAEMRAAVQPSSTMQLMQNISPRNSFFQQNSSSALVSSSATDGGSEKRTGISVQSANNLPIHPNASAQDLPVTSQRQECFGGLNASSVPVEGRRSEAQNQLLPSSTILQNNYNMENRPR
uniref:PHD-type domain-containing protein n=1 Tax=Odontella aurita TaxID=265563 RepID=A0A6U6EVL1_9STRA|mmetsp:Transcript_29371/g.87067  ORF Transcript_29371/g.87067 Transcript_29371/m.87067 type:complete len:2498 (+) Transcript_29371:112-7605(+)